MKSSRSVILIVIAAGLLSSYVSQAQSIFNKWRTGKVTLVGEQTFDADLFYKLKSEELEVKNSNEVKIYKAKDVTSFEIKDRGVVEVYLSLPFDLYEENSPLVFFQLLKEMNDFYFLSKKEPEVTNTYGSSSAGVMSSSYQPEILFFLTKEGKVEIYSSSNAGLMKMKVLNGNKKYIKTDLLKSLTDPYFDKLQEYADEHRLSFEKKEDMLVILDYYQSL